MLWLYILLGIAAFIALVLSIPVGIKLKLDGELTAKLKIAFVAVTLYPPKPKKEKKKKKKKSKKKEKTEEEKPKEKKPNIIKEKGLSWLIDAIGRVAELAKGIMKDFFSKVVIKRLELSVIYAGEDAADTAVKYGYLCSAIYPAVGIIAGAAKCRKYGVDVAPDFNDGAKTKVFFDFYARTRILWLVGLVLKNGVKALKLLIDLKKN